MKMKKKAARKMLVSALSGALALIWLFMLGGCARRDTVSDPAVPSVNTAPVGSPGAETAGRKDGERFEAVIQIEGMEETVLYEHVRNDALGFEMDYDCERFERQSGSDCERFVSHYDDPAHPENYLEVRSNPRDAEAVAAAVSAALSNDYEIYREDQFPLELAGGCIRIDASNGKGGAGTPDLLAMVYIIPADDGCRIATAHYSFESAEGFGRRFRCFMDSFRTCSGQREQRLTDEQAAAAIRQYCGIRDPELKITAETGEYPVYWDVSSSTDHEIVVVFRSYTGAQVRYHIDPVSGETQAAEFVPGITAEEQPTGERLNAWDYLF